MPTKKPSPVPVGTVLAGKFRITREVGRGGMAAVYEAENIDIGKRVAVKVLSSELAHSAVVTERFLREARAAAKIRSPHICDVYDVGTFEQRPFLLMELLEGESLYDLLARERRLSVERTLDIATQAGRGLQQAHDQNIVHRDLKPENIFLSRSGDGDIVVKLVDFGLAKFYEPHQGRDQARLTKEGALFGTPAYMSPEQAKAQGEVDHRADLWALACIVYEMLVGRTVWNVDQGVAMILAQIAGAPLPRPSRLRDDLPKSFDAWFNKALDRDIQKRFNSATELVQSLEVSLLPSENAISVVPLDPDLDAEIIEPQNGGPPNDSQGELEQSALEAQPNQPAQKPPAAKSPARRLMRWGLAVGAVALIGMLMWRFSSNRGLGLDIWHAFAQRQLEPLETSPEAQHLNESQERLADGNIQEAFQGFSEAFQEGKSKVARSFVAHTRAALEGAGPCKLTGLGHPRPFDAETKSSPPAAALTTAGLLVVWADNHEDLGKRHGYATLLDAPLRRVYPARSLTPEFKSVRSVALLPLEEKLALVYWSYVEPVGVFARMIEADGRIAGPPREVSESARNHQFHPAIARGQDGATWVVYSQSTNKLVEDLFVRQLDSNLTPLGKPVRVTAYATPQKLASSATLAAIDVSHGLLNIAYTLGRNAEHTVLMLRVNPKATGFSEGVTPAEGNSDPGSGDEEGDSFLGQAIEISSGPGRHMQPQIACTDEGCFVAWDNEKAGALVAYIRHNTGELVWHREFSPTGSRPSIGRADDQTVIAWFESNRLLLAKLTRDGVGEPSAIAKVSGFQPQPSIVPGSGDGEWYLAWRDYEAAELEPFVARANCK